MSSKKRILLIDDEPAVTGLLKLLLSREGYEVRVENDSRKCVEVANEFLPDMVFSDVDMPEVDGGEVARRLRAGMRRQVPIVFLSSLVRKSEIAEGSKLMGGYPFLAKPISKSDVLDVIHQHLHAA